MFPGQSSLHTITVSVAGFVLAVALTALVRAVARRFGAVAAPRADRWHKKPTAMFGGIGIFVAVIGLAISSVPHNRNLWVVIAASTALFIVGTVDDVLQIKPYQKLVGQLMGAAAVISFGMVLEWTPWAPVNILATFIWLIGITNAVNMLDNMDGLAAGVAAIAAMFLAVNFAYTGQTAEALLLAIFASALLGFLVFNHNPASIFMGDCGSMFIGFFLASTALLSGSGGGRSRSLIPVLAVPVFVFCVPIFDTTFVTLMRKLAGRAASQGGRDHTSHRLVALGLSEKHAVWMLYALAFASGSLALLTRSASLDVSIVLVATFVITLTFVGIHLARVHVYSQEEIAAAREKPLVALLVDLSLKRRVFEVLLDFVLITVSYYLAYAIKFGPVTSSGDWQLFFKTLPVVVSIKLATFLATGVYRIIWRYMSVANVIECVRAVAIGSTATIVVVALAFHFEGFSRLVLVFDAIALTALMIGSRMAFRFLRRLTPVPHASTGRRVLIYGAGDGGELLLRELNNNAALSCFPVAFIDDDPAKAGKRLHGLRIYPGSESLSEICRATRADELLLSTSKVPLWRLREIIAACEASGIAVRSMRIDVRRVADAEIGWVVPSELHDDFARPVLNPDAPRLSVRGSVRPGSPLSINH